MSEERNPAVIMKALDWAYDKAINGAGIVGSASALAGDYQKVHNDPEKAINSLINWQTTKCATSGFVTGLGGLLTMPVAIPANISSVLFMQLRMVAAIAMIRGYDPKSDQVQSLAYVCLTGSAASDILKTVGIRIGQRVTEVKDRHLIVATLLRQFERCQHRSYCGTAKFRSSAEGP